MEVILVPGNCKAVLSTLNQVVHQLEMIADSIVVQVCQQKFPSLHLISRLDAPEASSTQQLLFCKSHQFLQKMLHASTCQHCSRKPYRDQDMQDTVEEM